MSVGVGCGWVGVWVGWWVGWLCGWVGVGGWVGVCIIEATTFIQRLSTTAILNYLYIVIIYFIPLGNLQKVRQESRRCGDINMIQHNYGNLEGNRPICSKFTIKREMAKDNKVLTFLLVIFYGEGDAWFQRMYYHDI